MTTSSYIASEKIAHYAAKKGARAVKASRNGVSQAMCIPKEFELPWQNSDPSTRRFPTWTKASCRCTGSRWQQQTHLAMSGIEVLFLEPDVSSVYADPRAQLEAAGTPIGANDTFIAAHALALGIALVSGDAEFARVAGFQLENWLQRASV